MVPRVLRHTPAVMSTATQFRPPVRTVRRRVVESACLTSPLKSSVDGFVPQRSPRTTGGTTTAVTASRRSAGDRFQLDNFLAKFEAWRELHDGRRFPSTERTSPPAGSSVAQRPVQRVCTVVAAGAYRWPSGSWFLCGRTGKWPSSPGGDAKTGAGPTQPLHIRIRCDQDKGAAVREQAVPFGRHGDPSGLEFHPGKASRR